MATIAITGTGGVVRQTIPNGASFLGQAPADTTPEVVNGVIEFDEEPAASGNEFAQSAAANVIGSGYVVGEILTGVGGTFVTPFQIRVDTLGVGNGIGDFTIIDAGDYSVKPANAVSLSGGSGTLASVDVTWADLVLAGSSTWLSSLTGTSPGALRTKSSLSSGSRCLSAAVLRGVSTSPTARAEALGLGSR